MAAIGVPAAQTALAYSFWAVHNQDHLQIRTICTFLLVLEFELLVSFVSAITEWDCGD
jgi:hypothetical protein